MLATMFLHQKNSSPTLLRSVVKGLIAINPRALAGVLMLGLTLLCQQVSAQTVSLTVKPDVICEGNPTTLEVNVIGLPPGVTISGYEYNLGTIPPFTLPNSRYTHLYAPGNYSPFVKVTFTGPGAPAPITTAPVPVTVYHLPIASFSVITQDTQCFKSNNVCFDNLSTPGPSPSNPLEHLVWLYGNGFYDSLTTTADICHRYNAPGSFAVRLRATDTKGCYKDTILVPTLPVVIKPPITPGFTWNMRSGPCFTSNYLFTNFTPVALSLLKSYTYDFGDGTTYTGTAPFDAKEVAFYDTIGHDYVLNGEFSPGLTVTDITDCTDSIRYTHANSSKPIPKNIRFTFDVTTAASATSLEKRDSVCIGSYNTASICFKQTPNPLITDFVWNFDDPNSMQMNFNSESWNPCHTFAGGMKSYFVTLTVRAPCPAKHTFYAAATFDEDKYIDKIFYPNNDMLDANSQPRVTFDTLQRPGLKLPLRKLVYANSFVLSGGSYIGADTLFAYQATDQVSPIYHLSNDALVYTAGVFNNTIELPFNYYSYRPIPGTTPIQYDTFAGYRYYGYGARVIGPFARIEDKPNGVIIAPHHFNQCGPKDTVDFRNTSLSYKSRKVYRLWDFGDNYAPQCTSFSVPKKTVPIQIYPPIASIIPAGNISYDNGQTFMPVGPDTIRMWIDAAQQYANSDHYFIANGQTYGGKVNCKFSYDSLPRHHYPNWDTIYRYYQYGHDFMPWDPGQYGPGAGQIPIHPNDTQWWNKPVYLNPVTGEWSLTQGNGPSPYGAWVRIDTIKWEYNGGSDFSIGEPITVRNLPDPFRLSNVNQSNGQYPIISGGSVEPDEDITYSWLGRTYTINGSDLLPDGVTTFYQYAFNRSITRCIDVKMTLQDSLNNETMGGTGDGDSTVIDKLQDCSMEANVQLPFAKADARGLAKAGKECPGPSPNGIRFKMNEEGNFPGLVPSCGQTFILFNYDSLGDRMDGTPCALDAFTSYLGGLTPGGQSQLPYHSGPDFNPNTIWQDAGGTTIAYHYGPNAPQNRVQPADTAQGWVTVGIAIGSGCKDTLRRDVLMSLYHANEAYYQASITDTVRNNPGTNPVPGLPTMHTYKFTQLENFRPFVLPSGLIDTFVDINYQDCKFAKCMSDTVWYHRFLRITNLDATFMLEPQNCKLRHKGEEITVHYSDSIQDDVWFSAWSWSDNTMTVDSFYYLPDSLFSVCMDTLRIGVKKADYDANPAPFHLPITAPIPPEKQVPGGATSYLYTFNGLINTRLVFNGTGFDSVVDIVYTDCRWSDGYYINGVRRVRYNFDLDSGNPVLLDSTVWPVRASGIGATDGLKPRVSTFVVRRNNFSRMFTVLDRTTVPGKIVVLDNCKGVNDTMAYADTMQYYPIVQTIDSALAFFPIKHVFKRTSWEVAGKQLGAAPGEITHTIVSTEGCVRDDHQQVTIGIVDTFDILNGRGERDTLFCENEPVYFVDSLRYFRYDCILTDLPDIPAYSKSIAYNGLLLDPPHNALQIDSADFWRQDVGDPRGIQNIVPYLSYVQWNPFTNLFDLTWVIDTVVPERVYWDYGDGSPIDSSMRPVHRYASFGRYKVTMYSRDSLGWFDTCFAFVNISRPIAKIDYLRDASGNPIDVFGCGAIAQFLDSSRMATTPGIPLTTDSIYTNYWWFGDNKLDTVNWQSTNNPKATNGYNYNGSYRIKLVAETYQGCRDTTIDTIFVKGPRPLVQLVVQTDTIGCAPFKVRIMNLADSLGKQIDANGNPITDSVTKSTIVYWGDRNSSQTAFLGRRDTIEFTYDTTGVYFIYAFGSDAELNQQNNCPLVIYPDTPNMKPIRIEVIELKREVLLDKDVVCIDQPFTVSNNSDSRYTQYTYLYQDAQGVVFDSTVQAQQAPYNFTYSMDSVGAYRIIARPDIVTGIAQSAVEACKIPDTLNVKVVMASPEFKIDTVDKPMYRLINLSDTALNTQYEWMVRRQGSSSILYSYTGTNADPHYQFDLQNDTGTYEVCLTSYAKGIDITEACSDSTCQLISYLYVSDFQIPNVFSPNGDGMNDGFKALVKEGVSFKLTIYNRWGAKVFESTDPEQAWNGKALNEGSECPGGVYYYICDYKLRGQEDKTRTGTVTLIRE